jgi:hypothetical protein
MLLTDIQDEPIAIPADRVGVVMQSSPQLEQHPCTLITVINGGTLTIVGSSRSMEIQTLYVKQSVSEVEQMRVDELRDLAGNRQSDAHTRFGPQ